MLCKLYHNLKKSFKKKKTLGKEGLEGLVPEAEARPQSSGCPDGNSLCEVRGAGLRGARAVLTRGREGVPEARAPSSQRKASCLALAQGRDLGVSPGAGRSLPPLPLSSGSS